jgi:ABC-type uncharacterized transport system YnjBCD permease subunit
VTAAGGVASPQEIPAGGRLVETWMIVAAGVIVVLPFVLMVLFNAGNRADSRGRRVDHTWRARKQEI